MKSAKIAFKLLMKIWDSVCIFSQHIAPNVQRLPFIQAANLNLIFLSLMAVPD